MTSAPPRLDRRQRRRLETIEEVIDTAIEVMTEFGVGGLSLGEVARRMGLRTPSLYVYFDSKHAVYDAAFARGWREVGERMAPLYAGVDAATDLPAHLLHLGRSFVGWLLEHPALAQLMGWRVVPGYVPSAEAYGPAVEVITAARAAFVGLRDRGLFHQDADVDELLRIWTVLISGVMTQQLANAPDEPFEQGTFTSTLPALVSMFLTHHGTPAAPTRRKRP